MGLIVIVLTLTLIYVDRRLGMPSHRRIAECREAIRRSEDANVIPTYRPDAKARASAEAEIARLTPALSDLEHIRVRLYACLSSYTLWAVMRWASLAETRRVYLGDLADPGTHIAALLLSVTMISLLATSRPADRGPLQSVAAMTPTAIGVIAVVSGVASAGAPAIDRASGLYLNASIAAVVAVAGLLVLLFTPATTMIRPGPRPKPKSPKQREVGQGAGGDHETDA